MLTYQLAADLEGITAFTWAMTAYGDLCNRLHVQPTAAYGGPPAALCKNLVLLPVGPLAFTAAQERQGLSGTEH